MLQADTREARSSGAITLQVVILLLATAILVVDLALTLRQAEIGTQSTSAVEATVTTQPYIPSIVRPVEPTIAPAPTAALYIPSIVRPVEPTVAPAPTATPYIPAFLLPVDQTGS